MAGLSRGLSRALLACGSRRTLSSSRPVARTETILAPMTHLANVKGVPPLRLVSGSGIRVQDEDGNSYIEAMSGLWCMGLGWGNEELIAAMSDQMRTLSYYHGFTDRRVPVVEELASKLLDSAPGRLKHGKVFFGQSGSDANDTQIRLLWMYSHARGTPERRNFISRDRGYHGVTVGAGSLTGLPYVHGGSVGSGLPLDFATHVSAPHFYRNGLPGESKDEFVTRLANELDAEIRRLGPETVAGFIAEPLQGAGGVIIPPRGYHAATRKVCDAHGVMIMGDEVITGFGRTGTFWGCDHDELRMEPDLISCAKMLTHAAESLRSAKIVGPSTSAYIPLSATIVPPEIIDALDDATRRSGMVFGHGYTYSGHPVACAVALKVLEIYERDGLVERVRDVLGPRFQARLRNLATISPLVGESRGLGLIGAIELVSDKTTRDQFAPSVGAAALVSKLALARGLIVRPLPGDAVALCPPLTSNEADLDEIFDLIEDALAAAEKQLAPLRA